MEQEDLARKRAVALQYRREDDHAPKIVAKGSGLIAEKIIEIARQHGVTVYTDPDLVVLLSKLELGHYIPETLYQAVAEVLAFVYRLNGKLAQLSHE